MTWDHNTHYHRLLLRQLPTSAERALDIGCGFGDFAALLGKLVLRVDAIDTDASVLAEARRRHAESRNLNFILGDFIRTSLPAGQYDVVSALASIHHMDFAEALRKVTDLLKPGGTMIILGLYRDESIPDYCVGTVALAASRVHQWFFRRHTDTTSVCSPPLKEPGLALREIRRLAESIAQDVRIHRLLLWRYLLFWRKPVWGRLAVSRPLDCMVQAEGLSGETDARLDSKRAQELHPYNDA